MSAALISCSGGYAHAQAAPGVTFTTLYSFKSPNGINNASNTGLTLGSDGNIYGEDAFSSSGNGAIYKVTSSGDYTVVHAFNGTDGSVPIGRLALAGDGNLYGTTIGGGAYNHGTVFKITPAGLLTTIHSFLRTEGGNPEGPLTLGSDGNLYGSATAGFPDYSTPLFQVTTSGVFTIVGSLPTGDDFGLLVEDSGNLYGYNPDTNSGLGSLDEISYAGNVTNLGSLEYHWPFTAPTLGADGNFYGISLASDSFATGSVFKLTPLGQFTALAPLPADFSNIEPIGRVDIPMILGTDGNFYGTCYSGGANNNGFVYQLTPAGAYTNLYSFGAIGNSDGVNPYCSLLEGQDGALYGTTPAAEANNPAQDGTVFRMTVPSLTASIPTPPAAKRFDFNKDGHADLLWYNTASGSVSRWLMDDQAALQYGGAFSQVAAASGWMPVAAPQTTSDGYPDLLWWNSLSGEMSVWNLQDQSVTQYGSDFGQVSNTNWKPEAVADNNAKGAWTLVFEDAKSGDICRWLMNGTAVSQYGGTIASLGAKTPWQVVGAPDLDGDGKSDLLLWNSKTGEVAYWSMDLANSKVLAEHDDIAQIPDTSWHLVSSEDTNGDGHPDLVWWNAKTGEVSRWLMNGATVVGYGAATTQVNDTTWQPTAIR